MPGREDPRRDQVELEVPVRVDDGVAGVVAAAVADDEVRIGREVVDDAALPLVSPLRADDGDNGHGAATTTSSAGWDAAMLAVGHAERRRRGGAFDRLGAVARIRPGRAPCRSSCEQYTGRSLRGRNGTSACPPHSAHRPPRASRAGPRSRRRCRSRARGSAWRWHGSSGSAAARSRAPCWRRTPARRLRRRSPCRSPDSGWSCRRTPFPRPPVSTPGPAWTFAIWGATAICVRRGTGSTGLRSDAVDRSLLATDVTPGFQAPGRAGSSSVRGDLLAGGDGVEARVRLAELERHVADRSVAVLGDLRLDELDLGVGVLLAVAVEEDDDVGVLLEAAALAEVAEPRLGASLAARRCARAGSGQGPAPSARAPAPSGRG